MTPDTPLQDAVTLAADLQRTPVEELAKRIYHDLLDADQKIFRLRGLDEKAATKIERLLGYVFDEVSNLLHQDDCE